MMYNFIEACFIFIFIWFEADKLIRTRYYIELTKTLDNISSKLKNFSNEEASILYHALALTISGFFYLGFTVGWIFSSVQKVQYCGVSLITLSFISILFNSFKLAPLLLRRLDSLISIIILIAIVYFRMFPQ